MTPEEFYKHCYNRQFQYMIACEQIDKDGNIIGIVPNYTGFFESEQKEYYTGTAQYFQALLFNQCVAMQKYLCNGFSFLDIQNEVFDTNFNRIQRDKNGNIKKQPALLENGEPNPEAGKIIRKKLNPNLEQFFE